MPVFGAAIAKDMVAGELKSCVVRKTTRTGRKNDEVFFFCSRNFALAMSSDAPRRAAGDGGGPSSDTFAYAKSCQLDVPFRIFM